mmetsp:Transcript_8069/g.16790  ORF Transcript_8069/g.16790 Transcript_8069/m.16790 type:complete len:215 (-) Transcript_8069:7-651(-)
MLMRKWFVRRAPCFFFVLFGHVGLSSLSGTLARCLAILFLLLSIIIFHNRFGIQNLDPAQLFHQFPHPIVIVLGLFQFLVTSFHLPQLRLHHLLDSFIRRAITVIAIAMGPPLQRRLSALDAHFVDRPLGPVHVVLRIQYLRLDQSQFRFQLGFPPLHVPEGLFVLLELFFGDFFLVVVIAVIVAIIAVTLNVVALQIAVPFTTCRQPPLLLTL